MFSQIFSIFSFLLSLTRQTQLHRSELNPPSNGRIRRRELESNLRYGKRDDFIQNSIFAKNGKYRLPIRRLYVLKVISHVVVIDFDFV